VIATPYPTIAYEILQPQASFVPDVLLVTSGASLIWQVIDFAGAASSDTGNLPIISA
jgi:hypothetical protein